MNRLDVVWPVTFGAPVLSGCADAGGGEGTSGAGVESAQRPPAASAPAGDTKCSLDQPVKVGVVFSVTGGAAVYGSTQRNGVQLAVEELNAQSGITYELVVEDDSSDPAQGITAFEKLINQDQVSVIIGPTLSNTAFSADPIAHDGGFPVLAVSKTAAGITEIGEFIFRNSLTEAQVIPQTIETAAAALGIERVAVLYGNDDSFTVSGADPRAWHNSPSSGAERSPGTPSRRLWLRDGQRRDRARRRRFAAAV